MSLTKEQEELVSRCEAGFTPTSDAIDLCALIRELSARIAALEVERDELRGRVEEAVKTLRTHPGDMSVHGVSANGIDEGAYLSRRTTREIADKLESK